MEIITAKYVVTMEGVPPIVGGAMAFENSEIVDVGSEKDLRLRYPDATCEDYAHHALLPGLINAHTHLDMTLHKDFPFDPVRTLSSNVEYIDWLLSAIDFKKKATAETLRTGVEEGLASLIESGTTCVGDMGSFDGVFQTMEQSGIRAVIFPEVVSYDSFVARDLFETALAIVDKYMEFDSDLINVGMGPYAPYTLSRQLLKIMSQYGRSSNLPIMIHVAESFAEMEFFYNSTGPIATNLFPNIGWGDNLPPAFQKTPIQYLNEIYFLATAPTLVGCVQATDNDLDLVAQNNAKVVWCPRSNQYLKLGNTPIAAMHQKGICVALGTEGIPSTNTLSLWDELRAASEMTSDTAITSFDLLKMATIDAARALGIDEDVGSLVAGKKADFIVVDVGDHSDKDAIYTKLIRDTKSYHVDKVVVGGRCLKMVN